MLSRQQKIAIAARKHAGAGYGMYDDLEKQVLAVGLPNTPKNKADVAKQANALRVWRKQDMAVPDVN